MKKTIKAMLFLVMVCLVTGTSLTKPLQRAIANAAEAKSITVTGRGSVKAEPDIAYINVGVMTEDKNSKTAQEKNDTTMKAVLASLKQLGIDDKDITTSNFSIYPRYDYKVDYSRESNSITGYTVNNSVEVTVRNIKSVGEVLEKTIAAGANSGGGVRFSISNQDKFYEEALASAMKNGTSKANAIAKVLNVTVNAPSSVKETGGVAYAETYARSSVAYDVSGVSAVPIQSGELEISATVEMIFEY